MSTKIDRGRLAQLRKVEEECFLATHKKSAEAFADSRKVMHEGVPMSWMAKWPGAHPVFVKEAFAYFSFNAFLRVSSCTGVTAATLAVTSIALLGRAFGILMR